jgi:hypothetical protein
MHTILCFKGDIIPVLFVDSSGALYNDFKAHGGYVLSIGTGAYGGPVEVSSKKSKINCRSTMEFELVELNQGEPAILWAKMFLSELGFEQSKPGIIFEDNHAVLDLIKRGQVSSGVSRDSKLCYVRDLIARGLVCLIHCPTELMIADILTKNLIGKMFIDGAKRILNLVNEHKVYYDLLNYRLPGDYYSVDQTLDFYKINLLLTIQFSEYLNIE